VVRNRGDEGGAGGEGMSRNRGIVIFDACSSPLEDGFDSTECVTDGFSPFGTGHLGTDQIKASFEEASTSRAAQPLDPYATSAITG
jgi:hypothetical protein